MHLYRFIIILSFISASMNVWAGDYFIRLTPKGMQAKNALVSENRLSKSIPGTSVRIDKMIFKNPIQSSRHTNQFNNWLKLEISVQNEKNSLDSLMNEGVIDFYEPVHVFQISQLPNDSLLDKQWYLDKIKVFQAWEVTTGSPDIIVGVIDTGIDYRHPDLKGSLWTNEAEINGIDGIDDDNNGFVDDSIGWDFTDAPRFKDGGDYINPDNDPMDEYGSGHGTQVAGIIAAQVNNGKGIAGIGPDLRVMNIRAGTASGYLEEDDVANALIYALDNGARIVNMSFGDVALSRFLKDIIYYVYRQGLIMIASAGNSGNDEIHYPSGLAETISVGASNEDDSIAGFSNYGSTIDCAAPGSNIISTAVGGNYNEVSGTSFSAPIVSAIAGLILSTHPEFDPEQVRNILKTSSDDILNPGWDNYSGAGRVSAVNAVNIPDGGVLRFIHPEPNTSTALNRLDIIVTAIHPDINNILLDYGAGQDPQNWIYINSVANRQILADTLGTVNLAGIQDSVITLRLMMSLKNGHSDEIHSNIKIDRTAPLIKNITITPLYDGSNVSELISFMTDDICRTRVYLSRNFTNSPVIIKELGYETKSHRLKLNESEFGGEYQFYIEAENQSKLTSIENNNNAYYHFNLKNNFDWEEFTEVPWSLPSGYILNKPVDLNHNGKKEVIISRYDENQAFGHIEIFEFENDHFEKKLETGFNAIPRDAGDVDNDGLSDMLLGYGKYSFLFESTDVNTYPESLVWEDTVNFWAAGYADLDNDGKKEIIGRDDSSYIILENSGDNNFEQSGILPNPTSGNNQLSIPKFQLLDLNNDNIDEFIYGDFDGDLIVYQSVGNNAFQLYTTSKVSQFDATSLITGYNFQNSSDLFTASHTSDDLDYEHEFDARYWAIEHFKPGQSQNQLIKSGEINIFGYQNLKDFDSGILLHPFYDRIYLFSAFYPNLHIFKIENDNVTPVWFRQDVRSNTVLVADFDGDHIDEFYYNDGDRIKGFPLPVKNRPNTPNNLQASALDSNQAEIKWSPVKGSEFYRLYRTTDLSSMEFYRQIESNEFLDQGLVLNQKYYYTVSAVDSTFEVEESMQSPIDSVKTGLPPRLISGSVVNDKQIILTFDKKVAFSDKFAFTAYSVSTGQFNTSALILKDQKNILVGYADAFEMGLQDTIKINYVFDIDGVPVDKLYNRIEVYYDENPREPYLESISIVDHHTIDLYFNEPMQESDLLDAENYILYPQGKVNDIEINNEQSSSVRILLSGDSRIGALGTESYLLLKNMHSIKGALLDQSNKIYLNENISDLSKVFIYPQPVKPNNTIVTFAQLPDNVTIHIFNLNGKLIRTLEEETQFGGIQWDLKESNNLPVHSGIYIYRIIHQADEKIGKLVIVR